MKRKEFLNIIGKGFIGSSMLYAAGCSSFLDKTPASTVTDKDIFGTYESFQGFVDVMYSFLVDYNSHIYCTSGGSADFYIATQDWCTAQQELQGDYWQLGGNLEYHSNYRCNSVSNVLGDSTTGIYEDGWRGIRIANKALESMSLLVNATNEEKNLLKGQAYFFRAYFHWEIARAYGGIPFIDKVFQPTDTIELPRLSWQALADKLANDFDQAASLLPEDWNNTSVGGQFKGANKGRVTKGAALAFKAKTLLYAGSPLMNGTSGGSYTFNTDYMKKAAAAAWQVVQIANKGIYRLMSIDLQMNSGAFTEYNSTFGRNDGTFPWTDETIWAKVKPRNNSQSNGWASGIYHWGSGQMLAGVGRVFAPGRFGGNDIEETVTQNLVDMFEMQATGLPIDDPNSGYDSMKPWDGRDPRFKNGILIDGDEWTYDNPYPYRLQLYEGGRDKSQPGVNTPYICKKYWPKGVNSYDSNWGNFVYITPHMRLAEIYLIYAEAVNEAYGPTGTAPGAGITAIDAINVVRSRANMPNVNSKFTGSKETLRDRIWNERGVELFYENNRWHDIRRWHIATQQKYKDIYDLQFDANHTYFNRVKIGTRVFEERHYWLPFPTEQTELYLGFPQNPGW